jgi:ATP-dependent RNA helicase DeaD
VKLVHQASGPDDEGEEIPEPAPRQRPERDDGARQPSGAVRRAQARDARGRGARGGGAPPGVVRLFIGAGRAAGVRPADLVGAITGETGISGREVGAIEIGDRHSIVEVAEEVADDVVAALRATKIKGKRVPVRPE